jgi:single-strand DNA-binding protein
MSSLNKVSLIGNLGNKPEIRHFENGGRVANFSVATTERWTDKKTGEKREATEWHSIVVKNDNLIGFVEKWLDKGTRIYVEGQLKTRKWTKDDQDFYKVEIVLQPFRGEIMLLDGAKSEMAESEQPTA